MSINVFVHDDRVDIDLTGWDRVWSLKSHLEVAMADIVDARVASRSELSVDLGWRLGGTHWPGKITAGRYSTKGREGVRQFWDVSADAEVLLIETRLDRPWRIVLQHPDREFLAWVISERIHR
jgi:hypothetical protein